MTDLRAAGAIPADPTAPHAGDRSASIRTAPQPLWRRMITTPAFVAGVLMTLSVVVVALLAPVLAPFDPAEQNLLAGLLPPFSPEHLLGTDQLGRDILSRLLFAAQTDLRVALVAVITPFIVGVLLGTITGYVGGWLDWVVSRITDSVVAFPFYVIVIAVVFAVGAGERGIYLALALVGWVTYARVIRGTTAVLRQSTWVVAARGGGLSHTRIIGRHILPNSITQAVVLLMSDIVFVMVAVVTLSYLGLGIQPPTADWGTMINDGQAFIATRWWISAIPGLAVVYTGIGFSLLGDGIADVWRVR